MERKKLDEIMRKYVASTNNPIEMDFKKLNEKQESPCKKNIMPKFAWLPISIVLIISITLAIFLPLYLRADNNEGDDVISPPLIYYFDDTNSIKNYVDSLEDIYENYNFPQIKLINLYPMSQSTAAICDKENSEIVGIYLDMFVFDEEIESIVFHISPIEYSLDYLVNYTLNDEVIWNNTEVQYGINTWNNYLLEYNIKFIENNINYYLSVSCFNDINATEVLNHIFN